MHAFLPAGDETTAAVAAGVDCNCWRSPCRARTRIRYVRYHIDTLKHVRARGPGRRYTIDATANALSFILERQSVADTSQNINTHRDRTSVSSGVRVCKASQQLSVADPSRNTHTHTFIPIHGRSHGVAEVNTEHHHWLWSRIACP